MFQVNDDMSIYVTRGDVVFLSVAAENNGEAYKFQPGDVVRFKVFAKKDCEAVVLQKDFPVTAETDSVAVFLDENDTKIGEVISKPTDYWYEVELNPFTEPQTIIGYDEDGAKVFKLFPEGRDLTNDEPITPEDIPIVDKELDLTSQRPIENQAVARAVEQLKGAIAKNKEATSDAKAEIAVERARIDNLVTFETVDEELVDVRVGADATIYNSAGEAVRGQIKRLDGTLDKYNSNVLLVENLVTEVIEGKYVIGDTGSKLSVLDNSSYGYVKIPVVTGEIYSVNLGEAENNFSRITDANGVVLSLLSDARYTTVGYRYRMPKGAKWMYLCFSGLVNGYDIVVLRTDEDIVTNKVSVTDYPYGTVIRLTIPKLYIESVGKTLEEYADSSILYNKIVDAPTKKLVNVAELTKWLNSSMVINEGAVYVDVTGQNGGVQTSKFVSASDVVRVHLEGQTENADLQFQFLTCYTKADGTTSYGGSGTEVTISEDGSFEFDTTIDAANLAVYDNAAEFFFIFRSMNGADVGSFSLTMFDVWEGSALEKEDIYDAEFCQMIKNLNAKIDSKSSTTEDTTEESIESKVVAPNGNKYVLAVQNDGAIVSIPTIPKKALFVGNSLLLGMLNTYGMCASSPQNDYFYYVAQAIREKNSSAMFTKCHGAQFEMAEDTATWEAYWNTTANTYTGKPAAESFTEDLDLIVMQVSDNVNTDARQEAFANNIEPFVKAVRTNSPKARIVWVDGWYNDNRTHNIISGICDKWKIPRVNISDLNTTENQGYSGQTYVTDIASGETAIVKDTWITHPGDVGMKKIADRIIATLDM